MKKTENQLLALYDSFFKKMNIDNKSGSIKEKENLKFETYPFVGSEYEMAKTRILIVGLDIGKEEKKDLIQNFDDRANIERTHYGYNPHIAGTYITALYFLKKYYNWESLWLKLLSYNSYYIATRKMHHVESENPLKYIALTNFFKFVTKERINRAGSENRVFINKTIEEQLFIDEINILNPSIIVFQGYYPSAEILEKIKINNREIYKAFHPSYRKKNGRNIMNYLNSFQKL